MKVAVGACGLWLLLSGCVTEECEEYGVSTSVYVVDESGAPVCDATVVATRNGEPFSPVVPETVECAGHYRFINEDGRFRVSASRGGVTDETEFTVVNDGCHYNPSFGERFPRLVVK